MFYKPNFCCNCGEKIQRTDWKLLSSRRFCDVCQIENQGHEWLPRAIVGIGVIAGIFGFGTLMGSKTADQMVPVRLAQTADARQTLSAPESKSQVLLPQTEQSRTAVSSAPSASDLPALAPGTLTKEQPRPRNSASDDPVYYCGAMTKKGKPCSRRVKSKGRCWQHADRPDLEPTRQMDVY